MANSRIFKPVKNVNTDVNITPSDSIAPAFKSTQTADRRYFRGLRKLIKAKT